MNKKNNAVNVIHPYRTKHGIWVYDDEDLGVYVEPFVMGSSEAIDYLVGEETNHFTATISAKPLPMYTAKLLKFIHPEMDIPGWYEIENTDIKHWLCGHLLDYFPDYPDEIYVHISNKST